MQASGWTGFDEKEDLPRPNDNLPMRKTTGGRRWPLLCQYLPETYRITDQDYLIRIKSKAGKRRGSGDRRRRSFMPVRLLTEFKHDDLYVRMLTNKHFLPRTPFASENDG
ncbi:hypothetical protein PV10_08319 [Exophiala mesophila]|uniref:Uncharacterized protein n=1 Tax=Exophiala mesophila TaxID=212818 RepID=A0A0D1WIJ4_EXOME|nr:uncharacterized protein PV10_08319 [Exophiala mesophila]KIV88655.1 hypothetical protein PV10_08319 [Exophiala mesophila]